MAASPLWLYGVSFLFATQEITARVLFVYYVAVVQHFKRFVLAGFVRNRM